MKIIGKSRSKPANPAASGAAVRDMRVSDQFRFLNPQLVSARQMALCGIRGFAGRFAAPAICRLVFCARTDGPKSA